MGHGYIANSKKFEVSIQCGFAPVQNNEFGLVNIPGEVFTYSSFGYTLLGDVIQKVSGLGFEEYLKQHIWQKADMLDASMEKDGVYPNKSRLCVKVKNSHSA